MQFCQAHWDKMRESVKSHGMESLVSDSGIEVLEKIKQQFQGVDSISTYDPLMDMHWAILGNLPPYLSFKEGCPLCNANKDHAESCTGPPCKITDFEWMIDRSA